MPLTGFLGKFRRRITSNPIMKFLQCEYNKNKIKKKTNEKKTNKTPTIIQNLWHNYLRSFIKRPWLRAQIKQPWPWVSRVEAQVAMAAESSNSRPISKRSSRHDHRKLCHSKNLAPIVISISKWVPVWPWAQAAMASINLSLKIHDCRKLEFEPATMAAAMDPMPISLSLFDVALILHILSLSKSLHDICISTSVSTILPYMSTKIDQQEK